jgi:hypothetical protein
MATYFTEMTGIDPLTINQYAMTERSAPEREEPLYRQATERGLVARPVVFREARSWSGWKMREARGSASGRCRCPESVSKGRLRGDPSPDRFARLRTVRMVWYDHPYGKPNHQSS